ncbi:MAG: GIY-YIG nuclease family protein [Ignavibacterium sp.]
MQVRSLDNEIEFRSIIAVLKYYLYILKSEIQEKYYTGISNNVERRLEFHNTLEKGFTSRYRPWKIVYKKEFGSKEEARRYERKIKSWKSKAMIEKLIKGEIEL